MKEKLIGFAITVGVIGLLFAVNLGTKVLEKPQVLYQVYLDGKKIGLIESKQDLLDLIDKEESSIKEKFNVDKVYPPTGLDIEQIYTYDNRLVKPQDIYNQVKDSEPFTIKGYTVTINYTDKYNTSNTATGDDGGEEEEEVEVKEPLKIYVFDSEIMKKALRNVAETFIEPNELKMYEDGTQSEISDVGEKITSVYFDETITIKESYISTEEHIFRDTDELTQYLLYGTNDQQDKYTVKVGEDLASIAEDHHLNITELLIANPIYPSGTALLSPGEELNVGLINPLVSFTYRKTEVSDEVADFKIEYVDNNNKYTDYTLTKQDGVEGTKRVTKDILYVNGQVHQVDIVSEEIIKQPVNKIVERGTKRYSYSSQYTTPPTVNGGKFLWPTNSPYMIVSRYQWRWGRHHNGIDIAGRNLYGSPIYSTADGVVIEVHGGCPNVGSLSSRCNGRRGNNVVIHSPSIGYDVYYMHLINKMIVKVGQHVKQGEIIGYMGSSGESAGTHLHFELDIPGTRDAVDPCKVAFKC